MSRTVVIGGGIVGLSIAYNLSKTSQTDVVVLEANQLGTGSTAKATGGIRQQFTSEVNTRLVARSVELFGSLADETDTPFVFRQHGYLFLLNSADLMAKFTAAARMQNEVGVPTQILRSDEIAAYVPGVNVGDLSGATYCATDGSASPNDALMAYAGAARRNGVTIRQGARVTGFEFGPDGSVCGVNCSGQVIGADVVVIAAGPHARDVGLLAGVELPVTPRRRQAFQLLNAEGVNPEMPLTVDMGSGAYLHPEGSRIGVIGGNDRDGAEGFDERVDWGLVPSLIEALGHRFPRLESATVGRGWAGVREMTPDDHAIVGEADVPGLWLAVGFSGHGFMQAPAVGEAVAAGIVGTSPLLDLTALRPCRFADGDLVEEAVVF